MRHTRLTTLFAGVLACTAIALTGSHAASLPRYQATDLGTFGGNTSLAEGLNDAGQVVGVTTEVKAYENIGAPLYGFLWRDGKLTNLGINVLPCAVTGSGQVAYGTMIPVGGRLESLGTPSYVDPRDDATIIVRSVNDEGQAVGDVTATVRPYPTPTHPYVPPNPVTHAFFWQGGKFTDLGTLGGANSHARAVNDRGQVGGESDTADGHVHAFLWQNGRMTDIGKVIGAENGATAIDRRGQIVGSWLPYAADDKFGHALPSKHPVHAFLDSGGKVKDLGTLPGDDQSGAEGVNDAGEVVGSSSHWNLDGQVARAFLWRHGRLYDLNRLAPLPAGQRLRDATAINNRGQIAAALVVGTMLVGAEDRPTDQYHACLLTPLAVKP